MRNFDKTFFLLIPYFAVSLMPALRLRLRLVTVLPIVLIWLASFFMRRQLADKSLRRFFWIAFVPMALFQFVRAYIMSRCDVDVSGAAMIPLYSRSVTAVMILVPMLIFHFTMSNFKIREGRCLVWFVLLFFCIGALLFANFEVGSTRLVATGIDENTSAEVMRDRYNALNGGVSSFGSVYAMAIALPFFLFLIPWASLFREKWKWLAVVVAVIFAFGMIRATYSIALVGIAFGGILFMIAGLYRFYPQVTKWVAFPLYVIAVIIVAEPSVLSFLAPVFDSLADSTEITEYRMRFDSIAEALRGDTTTYASMRSDLFVKSWRTFCHFPLFGRMGALVSDIRLGSWEIGGHSYIIDSLGNCGILLVLLYFMSLYFYGRYLEDIARRFAIPRRLISGWHVSAFTLLFVSTINQLDTYEPYVMIFLVIPGLIFWSGKAQENIMGPWARYGY